ncbi:HAD family hydrolase [Terricaulis sp.]|uniref:HAD family hydrolase n=1 Tax=Terricaulis sp. TaxID=2768686 RepID=UPI0037839767
MKLPRRPAAVVFDLDGTLIDSELLVRDALQHAARTMGVEMTDAQFLALVGLQRDTNDQQLLGYYGPDFALDEFHGHSRAWMGERIAPLKSGVLEILDVVDALPAPAGVVTSSSHDWAQRHFGPHKLADRFRAIIARGDYTNAKPHPEPYLKAAQVLGVAPAAVLAIEDSHTGVRAAHAAGMMTVMAPDLLSADDEMHAKALHVVDSLHDVIKLLG